MAVILIFLSFFLSFLFFIEISYNENISQGFKKREAFIKSSLLISFLSYLICEIYSLFNILNYLFYKNELHLLSCNKFVIYAPVEFF